jgi:hypothetical protein
MLNLAIRTGATAREADRSGLRLEVLESLPLRMPSVSFAAARGGPATHDAAPTSYRFSAARGTPRRRDAIAPLVAAHDGSLLDRALACPEWPARAAGAGGCAHA